MTTERKAFSLGALKNNRKRKIGGRYQLKRFSVGDVLMWCGARAKVVSRDIEKKQIVLHLLDSAESQTAIMDDLLYEFVEACPAR